VEPGVESRRFPPENHPETSADSRQAFERALTVTTQASAAHLLPLQFRNFGFRSLIDKLPGRFTIIEMKPSTALRIELLFMLSLFCAGCADNDPFQTFFVPGYQTHVGPVPAYSGPPLPPATADPPVEYVPVISIEESKRFASTVAAQGYSRIGMSLFETNWPAPHRDAAAEMGRKLGADLVLYVVVPVGTRLQSVPHITYEPGQTYSGTTSGVVGGVYGSFHTYGSSPGSFHTQYSTEEVGRYIPNCRVLDEKEMTPKAQCRLPTSEIDPIEIPMKSLFDFLSPLEYQSRLFNVGIARNVRKQIVGLSSD